MTDTAAIRQSATPASPAETIALANELASYARAAADPVAMIEAARTLRSVPRDLFTAGMATPSMLFAEARILADSDPEMLAEIDWVQHDTPRTVRIVGGNYVQDVWAVAHRGNGTGLKPAIHTLPPLKNSGAVWSVSFPVAAN
jgi:hypothetical protein